MTDNQYFNPFTDRLSRDIRNDLSSALLQCLQNGSTESAETVATRYLDQRLAEVYIRYINERLDRYRKAVAAISGKVDDPFLRSFLLWDLGLFFEMHEVLEHDWYHAEGDTKLLMQALIRAAGITSNANANSSHRQTRSSLRRCRCLTVSERFSPDTLNQSG